MAINTDALKSRIQGLVLSLAPDNFKGLSNYQTKVYGSQFAPGATLAVSAAAGNSAALDPSDYLAGSKGCENVTIQMHHVFANRHLTFAEIQQGLDPQDLVTALIGDINTTIQRMTYDAIHAKAGGEAAVVKAPTLKDAWKTVRGTNKCVIFCQTYLEDLQSNYQDYKMGADNTFEPGYLGYSYAKYNDDDMISIDGNAPDAFNRAIVWSKNGLVLGLGQVIPIGDENETIISTGDGLPGLYSRVVVNEQTRLVTVTLELMAGVAATSADLVKVTRTLISGESA